MLARALRTRLAGMAAIHLIVADTSEAYVAPHSKFTNRRMILSRDF